MTSKMTRGDLIGYLIREDSDGIVVLKYLGVELNIKYKDGKIYLDNARDYEVVLQVATKSRDVFVGLMNEEWDYCLTLPRTARYDYIMETGTRILMPDDQNDWFIDGTGDDDEVWEEIEQEIKSHRKHK